ncbi:unnamed protein product [Caenorhabditis angaria]|uniref:Tyrosine-protein phosphatase domain-containing protein n=1 Tax=Caenorhabditis angaria TaxID=860376 RepID=A0A9P1MUY7_9PELO|nr:unnamed protein product [Caenorhabditis angaria]
MTTKATKGTGANAGFQALVEAETVDEFVHSQTTRNSDKYKKDLKELNEDEKKIERFIANGDKNRYLNIARYDEYLDMNDADYYVHANTFKTPYGRFIISQAPLPNTRDDQIHLIWLYNVRTIVVLTEPEEAGGYFSLEENGSYTVFLQYKMTTVSIHDEKQGITVYQCELNNIKTSEQRFIYVICCPTDVHGLRNTRMQAVALEYMWAHQETLEMEDVRMTSVLVHGESGTRRCASFIASAVMCRQILETGKFTAMETWVELRKRRCCTCRMHDFYSSLSTVFCFCAQCAIVSMNDPKFLKTMDVLKNFLDREKGPGAPPAGPPAQHF